MKKRLPSPRPVPPEGDTESKDGSVAFSAIPSLLPRPEDCIIHKRNHVPTHNIIASIQTCTPPPGDIPAAPDDARYRSLEPAHLPATPTEHLDRLQTFSQDPFH